MLGKPGKPDAPGIPIPGICGSWPLASDDIICGQYTDIAISANICAISGDRLLRPVILDAAEANVPAG